MSSVIYGVIILFVVIIGLTIWVTNKAYSRKDE
ncbi:YtzI protein [Brevibacillus migulae]